MHHYLIELLVFQLPLQDWESFNKAISRGCLQIVHPDSIEFCPIDKSLEHPQSIWEYSVREVCLRILHSDCIESYLIESYEDQTLREWESTLVRQV
jgi:hypothetical protein